MNKKEPRFEKEIVKNIEKGEISVENKEEIDHNLVTLICLRHGRTQYLEDSFSEEEKEKMKGEYPLDLTKDGEEEIRKKAKEILTKLNHDKDLVVLWGSPAWRAQGSEKIIKEELENGGIDVLKDKEIDLLMHGKMYDKQHMIAYWQNAIEKGESTDWIYAYDEDFKKNNKVEQISEVKKRVENYFHYIQYLSERINLKEKRLVIISVSHFEVLNPIIDDIFGTRKYLGSNEIIKKGEEIVFNFDYDKKKKRMTIDVTFRGVTKRDIYFDKNDRHFKISNENDKL